jgi:hypothetical protein
VSLYDFIGDVGFGVPNVKEKAIGREMAKNQERTVEKWARERK